MFTIAEDFVAPYQLTNLNQVEAGFEAFTNAFEEKALRSLLGDLLYDAMIAALPAAWNEEEIYFVDSLVTFEATKYKSLINDNIGNDPEANPDKWEAQANDRWFLLAFGSTYSYIGKTYRYKGFNNLLVPYIYSEWLKYNARSQSGVGTTVTSTENSIGVSSAIEIVKGWNDYVELAGTLQNGMMDQVKTLYGYLKNSGDTFLDVVVDEWTTFEEYLDNNFEIPEFINEFDI